MNLDKLSSPNDGMLFYPSGNIAVSVYQTPTGRVINILSDTSEPKCGEDLKRSDSYLEKVTAVLPGGKLQMDIDAIRNRQKEIGSLYIPPGPHHTVTRSPGTGILKTLVKTLTDDCLTQEVIDDMDTTQFRLGHLSSKGKIRGGQTKLIEADLPEDLGRPTLTKTQKKFQALTDGTAVVYTTRRLKLPLLAMKDVDNLTVGPDAPSDMLIAVCVLAKWNPVCNRIEAKLEEANHQLTEDRENNKSSPAGHIQVYKVDASEGWTLQLRYDFRTVPMFLMYYGGKLVYASNAIRSKQEMLDVSQDALTKGRKGIFMAEHFSFRGMDNFVLDSITNEMSLLQDI
ncbi:hypothetical protein BSKO_04286 [Bryopsis sp. KO-2023]|nr:hypothetical protein BSKO_04286 [Bryopsis sp. KO-2023]